MWLRETDETTLTPILFSTLGTFSSQAPSSWLDGVGAQPTIPGISSGRDTGSARQTTHVLQAEGSAVHPDAPGAWKTTPASHPCAHASRVVALAHAPMRGTRARRPSRWRVGGLPAKLRAAHTVSVGVGHRLISKPISFALMSPQKSGHILALTPPQNCGGLLAPTQLRNKLSPSPHPTLDALAVVQRGGEWGVEDAGRPALNPVTCSPPWPSLTPCHPRRRSTGRAMQDGACVRWLGRGRARAAVGSLGPAGGVVPAGGPLVRSEGRPGVGLETIRDRLADSSSGPCPQARLARVFWASTFAVSAHLTTPTRASFRRAAR